MELGVVMQGLPGKVTDLKSNRSERNQILYEKQFVKINLDHRWGLWDLRDSIFPYPGAWTHFIIPNHFKTERHLKTRSVNLFIFSNPSFVILQPLLLQLSAARGPGSPGTPPLSSLYRVNIKSQTYHPGLLQ